MKFRKIDISSDYFENLFPYYSVVICLYSKFDGFEFEYMSCIDDEIFFLEIQGIFGDLELSSFKFGEDAIFINFNLDYDLFSEFRNFLEERGLNCG